MKALLAAGLVQLGVVADLGTWPVDAAEFPEMVGLNVPWNNFGYDIGNGAFDSAWFEKYFSFAESNGHNIARFWVHTDGARAGLEYNQDGSVKGLSASYNSDLRSLLTIARNHKVVLQLCLWSFDMCKDETQKGSTKANIISNEAISRSYVKNALKPMLAAVSDFDNLIIETINEPEWCMKEAPGNTKDMVSASEMQRFVAMIAEAAHEAGRKVTTGGSSLKWSSSAPEAVAFYWADSALKKAYPSGSNVGMDFYNVHYYDWMHNDRWGYDPMRKNVTYWGLDKPTVVAELPAKSKYHSAPEMLQGMTTNGFKGALFWAYNDPSNPVPAAPTQALKDFAARQGASYEKIISWLGSNTSPSPPVPTAAPMPPTALVFTV